jgi:hypothetical protein
MPIPIVAALQHNYPTSLAALAPDGCGTSAALQFRQLVEPVAGQHQSQAIAAKDYCVPAVWIWAKPSK